MRIALTGADGFTGAFVQAELARRGIEAVALGADLTDPAAVRAEVAAKPFDHLIHLAGEAFTASDDSRPFYEVNFLGTMTLLDAVAARRPGARCILASTAQVYGADAAGTVDEDQPARPVGHYAFSKLAMETCAPAFADKLEIVITRPFNYTGVGQQVRYVIPKIIDHFRRRADRIELGNIDVLRDFGDVRSVAEAYVGIALAMAPPPVLNISTGQARPIREVIALAAERSGYTPEIVVNPAFVRANDVPKLVGDHNRLSQVLPKWRPRPLADTVTWMLGA